MGDCEEAASGKDTPEQGPKENPKQAGPKSGENDLERTEEDESQPALGRHSRYRSLHLRSFSAVFPEHMQRQDACGLVLGNVTVTCTRRF